MPEPVRAKDVTVEKVFRARCHLCDWRGGEQATYQEANTERLGHMAWHTLSQPEDGEADG